MFSRIMVPVDLEHVDRIGRSLRVAADLARLWSARVVYVAVCGSVPNRIASDPGKFAAELDMFAREQADEYGIETEGHAIHSNDVAAELDRKLLDAIGELDADLVVMASHIPDVPDRMHLISSNASWITRHASVSVMVVRPEAPDGD